MQAEPEAAELGQDEGEEAAGAHDIQSKLRSNDVVSEADL